MSQDSVDLKELEELLKEEETPSRNTRKCPENRTVLRFIEDTKVRPGEHRVPTYVIYYIFCKWIRKTQRRPVGKEGFFRTFKTKFDLKRSGKQRYYMVNDAWELTEELYEKAETHRKSYQKDNRARQS